MNALPLVSGGKEGGIFEEGWESTRARIAAGGKGETPSRKAGGRGGERLPARQRPPAETRAAMIIRWASDVPATTSSARASRTSRSAVVPRR